MINENPNSKKSKDPGNVLRIEQSLVGRASVSWARDLARATPATLGWSAQHSPAVTAVTMQTRRCHCHLHCVLMGQCLK